MSAQNSQIENYVAELNRLAVITAIAVACAISTALVLPTVRRPEWLSIALVLLCIIVPLPFGLLTVVAAMRVLRTRKRDKTSRIICGNRRVWISLLVGLFGCLWAAGILLWIGFSIHPESRTRSSQSVKPDWKLSPPTSDHVELRTPGVPLQVLVADINRFLSDYPNTENGRPDFCASLLKESGYEPQVSAQADVWAFKEGKTDHVVVVGAHHDKVDGPSQGILDNLVGCVVVARSAHVLRPLATRKSYLFIFFNHEEKGRNIPIHLEGMPSFGRPEFIINVDYVGDRYRPLCAGWLSPSTGYRVAGISLSSFMHQPDAPSIIHTAGDNISNVDSQKLHKAYETILGMLEDIEKNNRLEPPKTVLFSRKDRRPRPLIENPRVIRSKKKEMSNKPRQRNAASASPPELCVGLRH